MLSNYTDETGRAITEGVYTLGEFIEAAAAPAVNPGNADTLREFREERSDVDWMGLREEIKAQEKAFACTVRLVREGWRNGLNLLSAVADKVTAPTPKTVRRYQRWQDQGDNVDMQRIWGGNLEKAWRGTHRDTRHGPQRVRILIDSIESGGNGADGMRWRGVAALKLSDLLSEAGYSVQVESVISCKDSHSQRVFKLRAIVKAYDQPVDLLTLAPCTALPAFFRSLMHAWGLAAAPNVRASVSYQVRTPTADEFPDGDENCKVFVIPGKANTAEKASTRITEIIDELDEAGE